MAPQMAAVPSVVFTSSRSDEAFLQALRADVPAAGGGDASQVTARRNPGGAFFFCRARFA